LRRELLIAAGPGEWRAAWLEDGIAVELFVERGDIAPWGSIHLGRVVRLVGALDAALVDIGEARPGFLPLRQPLDEGARVLVEVRREAQRGKGARLTTRIAEDRLAALAARVAGLEPPEQLDPPPEFAAALAARLPGEANAVVTDDTALLRELRGAFPDAEVAQRPLAGWPLDIDALFETALSPSLALPGGGSLRIAESDAAVLIDVDTGSPEVGSAEQGAMAANLAAAAAIGRQIRQRQLVGGIVVDFAALEGSRPRERVRQAVVAALAGDPAQPQVLGWTRLGHLEIVRPRRLRSLSDAMLEPQSVRKNAVTLAFEALHLVTREARAWPAANWRVVVAPAVAAALHGPAAAGLRALEDRLGRTVAIAVEPDREARAFDIVPL
jgi:ribonuclease G